MRIRSIEYSHPPQKTAQLWSKNKDELNVQLQELKSYVIWTTLVGSRKWVKAC